MVRLLYLQIVVWCSVNVQNPIYLTLSCPLRNIQIKVVFFLVARHTEKISENVFLYIFYKRVKQVCRQAEKFMSVCGQIKKSLYCYTCSLKCCWEQTSNTEQKKADLKKKIRHAPNQVLTNMPRPFFSCRFLLAFYFHPRLSLSVFVPEVLLKKWNSFVRQLDVVRTRRGNTALAHYLPIVPIYRPLDQRP